MHIHPSSPNSSESLQSEESAAIKIQAGFRGYRVRKQLHNHSQPRCASLTITNGYHHHQSHRSASHRRRQQRQQQAMENQSGTGSQVPSSTGSVNGVTSSAAAQLRDERSSGSESNSIEDRCATKIQANVRGFLVRKKQKIATDAATKIQAGFRGFKVRKETQKLKQK